ncbi:MAG: cation:proton antiporter [Flavobacteriales bacterium]
MELPLLPDIVIILGLSVFIILIFQRLRMPAILGFLVTGILAGPHGFNLIHASHEVELLSEIGIIFLLFVIGIEFSLKGLLSIWKTVVIGGLIQVLGTIGLTTVAAYYLGLPLNSAVFLGFLFALSSTAIVLKTLQSSGEITAPHGRVSVALLIFQDVVVVLMMLMIPLLAGKSEDPGKDLLILAGKLTGVLGVLYLMGRFLVPTVFKWVVRAKSRELFLLTTMVLCFATAWMTSAVGLSLALGAFFAGLIISESDYSHQATANILPFREIFISFFFVSVGMLLDLSFFFEHFATIHLLAVGAMALKFTVIVVAVWLLRYAARTVLLSGLALFQVGEFSFLLAAKGMDSNLLTDEVYQYFLAVSIISMGATPFVIQYSKRISNFILTAPLPSSVKSRLKRYRPSFEKSHSEGHTDLTDHIIIIGYGINGQNVARAARQAGIAYAVIELDPDAHQHALAQNEPVVFGDACDYSILEHVHIQDARVIVVAISSPEETRKIVANARVMNRTAYLIVRTRHIGEIEANLSIGADEVIPEEFETSVEIFTKVLKKYLVPADEVAAFAGYIRAHNYELLRTRTGDAVPDFPYTLSVPDVEIATLVVEQGNNSIVGKCIGDSQLRKEFNVNVLAIRREGKFITRLTPETTIEQDDVLYLFGNPDCIARVNRFLSFGD